MSLDTTTTISSAFDKLYAKVPADQVARLIDFRRTHPVKHLAIGDTGWEYIACGLIIESDDDVISAHDRELLRNTYPQAEIYTFHGAGHASSIMKREEVVSIIRSFLQKA